MSTTFKISRSLRAAIILASSSIIQISAMEKFKISGDPRFDGLVFQKQTMDTHPERFDDCLELWKENMQRHGDFWYLSTDSKYFIFPFGGFGWYLEQKDYTEGDGLLYGCATSEFDILPTSRWWSCEGNVEDLVKKVASIKFHEIKSRKSRKAVSRQAPQHHSARSSGRRQDLFSPTGAPGSQSQPSRNQAPTQNSRFRNGQITSRGNAARDLFVEAKQCLLFLNEKYNISWNTDGVDGYSIVWDLKNRKNLHNAIEYVNNYRNGRKNNETIEQYLRNYVASYEAQEHQTAIFRKFNSARNSNRGQDLFSPTGAPGSRYNQSQSQASRYLRRSSFRNGQITSRGNAAGNLIAEAKQCLLFLDQRYKISLDTDGVDGYLIVWDLKNRKNLHNAIEYVNNFRNGRKNNETIEQYFRNYVASYEAQQHQIAVFRKFLTHDVSPSTFRNQSSQRKHNLVMGTLDMVEIYCRRYSNKPNTERFQKFHQRINTLFTAIRKNINKHWML